MKSLLKKLVQRFKAVSVGGMSETAKECRDAANRYRACADLLDAAGGYFNDAKFDAGFEELKKADEAIEKKA